jgi:hypothetical protein
MEIFDEAFDKYFQEHPSWGSMHIIMADNNPRMSDVVFCKKIALENNDLEGYWLLCLLEQLNRLERLILSRRW